MSITITDPNLLAQLAGVSGVVQVTDANGRHLGTFTTESRAEQLARLKCPFSEEELARRSQIRTGRPLAEVWKTIYEKYVGDDVEPMFVENGKAVE
jgi:hypothetical protein